MIIVNYKSYSRLLIKILNINLFIFYLKIIHDKRAYIWKLHILNKKKNIETLTYVQIW